jgi:ribA/ribD-fused uncharacterized protein
MSDERITRFAGKYRFLSNFYMATILYEGTWYPSVEHAYQAAKTLDRGERDLMAQIETPGDAKRLGQRITPIRSDWEAVKLTVMETLLRAKFSFYPELRAKLLATGEAQLSEGNTWGDSYWGMVAGFGENHLGKLLMKIREELR